MIKMSEEMENRFKIIDEKIERIMVILDKIAGDLKWNSVKFVE